MLIHSVLEKRGLQIYSAINSQSEMQMDTIHNAIKLATSSSLLIISGLLILVTAKLIKFDTILLCIMFSFLFVVVLCLVFYKLLVILFSSQSKLLGNILFDLEVVIGKMTRLDCANQDKDLLEEQKERLISEVVEIVPKHKTSMKKSQRIVLICWGLAFFILFLYIGTISILIFQTPKLLTVTTESCDVWIKNSPC